MAKKTPTSVQLLMVPKKVQKARTRKLIKKAEKIAEKEDRPAPPGGFDYYLDLAKGSQEPPAKASKSLSAFLADEGDEEADLDFDALTREIKGQ